MSHLNLKNKDIKNTEVASNNNESQVACAALLQSVIIWHLAMATLSFNNVLCEPMTTDFGKVM